MTHPLGSNAHNWESVNEAGPLALPRIWRTALIVITTITAIAIVSLIAITPHIAAKAVVENEGKEE